MNTAELRADLETALAIVAKQHGVKFFINEFLVESLTEVSIKARAVKVVDQFATSHYETTPVQTKGYVRGTAMVGRHFTAGRGGVYTVTEYNPRRPQYPYSGRGPEGGRWRFKESQVRDGLIAA